VEAYVYDVVAKTTERDELVNDLAETFSNLRTYKWKLNLTQCIFRCSLRIAPGLHGGTMRH
jgi:hypothetical protein